MGRPFCFVVVALLLASGAAYAEEAGGAGGSAGAGCPAAVRSIYVPAVVGEFAGGVLSVEVETRQGDGLVYSATTPRVGVSTQGSEETAAAYALKRAGLEKAGCDILYRVRGTGESRFIDGPSAGAAMTLATIAALENRSIRRDVAVTGSIAPDGSVGTVGGLIEKGKAAAERGIRIMLTPRQELYERMVFSSLGAARGISFLEVGNISAASAIVFAPEGTPAPEAAALSLKPRELPKGLERIAVEGDAKLEAFREVAGALLRLAERDVDGLPEDSRDANDIKEYFRAELASQRKLLELGYLFPAANAVFLMDVDIGFFGKGYLENIDMEEESRNALNCIASLREGGKREDDFEWKVGADLRKSWAEKKLNETLEKGAASSEEKYIAYRELLFSESWCRVSALLGAKEGKGKPINESAWEGIAGARIREAEEFMKGEGGSDPDSGWHLEAARYEAKRGRYGAAVYDAAYALAMERADEEFDSVKGDSARLNRTVAELSERKMRSLWGKVYQAQGRFLYAAAGYEPKSSAAAFRVLRFAEALENATAELEAGAKEERAGADEGSSGRGASLRSMLALGGATAAILLIIAVYFMLVIRGGGKPQ